ncbi:MAG: hypothetical protein KF893_14105 [Caldilineaceae bacterium]|nr:hypothetical protein [Caldilineaceae bacterium]
MMKGKSVSYQQLQTVMSERTGCPVCHVGHDAGHFYLDNLLWESVNDPELRTEILAAMGFCGDHYRQLMNFGGERLGVAIIQRAVMQEALRHLQGTPTPTRRSFTQRLQDRLRRGDAGEAVTDGGVPLAPCPTCRHESEVEERTIQGLLADLVDDLDAPLQQVGGLCWAHLQRTLRLCKDDHSRALLIEMHQNLWSQMIEDLGQFIRKLDHRFRDEVPSEATRWSVERSIAVITGEYSLR